MADEFEGSATAPRSRWNVVELTEAQHIRRIEWIREPGAKPPAWCLECWDAPPTQPIPRNHEETRPLLCERCATAIATRQAERDAAIAEVDRHGYTLSPRLRTLLIDLVQTGGLPDARPATLAQITPDWWAECRGIGPVLLRQITGLQRQMGQKPK